MSQLMVWTSGLLSFEYASQVLDRIGQMKIAATTLWDHTQRHGQRLQSHIVDEEQRVSLERTRWHEPSYDAEAYRSISMDGGMVYIRGEGWKELKAGVVSRIEHQREDDRSDQTIRLVDLDYVAVIGEVNSFAPKLWALAVKHQVPFVGHSAVTADGASWIWRLSADLFPDSFEIVDWYHAKQHLMEAAHARHPDNLPAAQRWYQLMTMPLFKGEIWKITDDLQRHNLNDHARYFLNHRRRMHYQAFRTAGYPIGSGSVESAIKQYKHRLTGPGMRWSRQGAERMAVIRSAILANSFDALWDAA